MRTFKFIVEGDRVLDTAAALDAGQDAIEEALGVPVLRSDVDEVAESDYWTADGRDASVELNGVWIHCGDEALWRVKGRQTYQNSNEPDAFTIFNEESKEERVVSAHELKAAYRPKDGSTTW